MGKKNKTPAEAKAPKDFSKVVTIIKVVALFTMLLAALFMVGMLVVPAALVKVLGYALMVVTVYFALSIVK